MTKTLIADDSAAASCTLPTVERPPRLAEFDDFFRGTVRRSPRPSMTRLDPVILRESGAGARHLAECETRCCSFFNFKFDHAADGLVMRISVPRDHVDVLDALQARIFTVVGVTTVNADV